MSTTLYFECFLSACLGALIHLFVIKFPSEMQRAKVANVDFSLKSYMKEDWASIAGNLCTIALALLLISEWVSISQSIQPYIRTLFAFVGFTGSSVAIAAFGRFGKKLNAIVDIKTDKADGKNEADKD